MPVAQSAKRKRSVSGRLMIGDSSLTKERKCFLRSCSSRSLLCDIMLRVRLGEGPHCGSPLVLITKVSRNLHSRTCHARARCAFLSPASHKGTMKLRPERTNTAFIRSSITRDSPHKSRDLPHPPTRIELLSSIAPWANLYWSLSEPLLVHTRSNSGRSADQ